eukprot:ctg_4606.g524
MAVAARRVRARLAGLPGDALRHYLERPDEVPEWDDVECIVKWDVPAADGDAEWVSQEGTAGTASPVPPAATHGATDTDPITLEPVRAAA